MSYGDKYTRGTRGATANAQSYGRTPAASTCPPAEPPPPPACCDLVCFDRPRYFCGHLLTDDDLSLDQRYQIEKNKLYHRALHGSGVVCGLRLTCDPVCAGGILVGDGFAIDDCGNDLVVCGPTPVDVVGQLQEKGYLLGSPKADPCEPPTTPPDCNVRQCFFVTACYVEEEHEFTTPLTPGCGPSPRECEPTRIRESVRFDIVNDMPVSKGPLFDLKCRLESCFALFTEGPFATALRDSLVLDATSSAGVTTSQNQQVWEEFCKLRGLLLLYLESHPDHYNCTLEDDVRAVEFPPTSDNNYTAKVRDAFCGIIELAYQHVLSCAFGALTFSCSEPRLASCVLLGTVEVCNGQVVRVCNCPRWYVWSFASFFQVLIATLFGSLACQSVDQTGHDPASTPGATTNTGTTVRGTQSPGYDDCGCGKSPLPSTCCREFTINDCSGFIRSLLANRQSAADVVTAPLTLISEVTNSLRFSLNPTSQSTLSPKMFLDLNEQQANELAKQRGVNINVEAAPTEFPIHDPVRAFLSALQAGPGSSFRLYKQNNTNTIVRAEVEPDIYARIASLENEINLLKAQTPPASGSGTAEKRRTGRPKTGPPSTPKTNGPTEPGEK